MGTGHIELSSIRTVETDTSLRRAIVELGVAAHEEEDFRNLFSYLPPDDLHVLAYLDGMLVGHAVVTTRWLESTTGMLRTAYVDAVSTSPEHQGCGIGSLLMRHLAHLVRDYDIACLETEVPKFFEQVGWERWRGPLAGRSNEGLVATPGQEGIMILRLPRTPSLDLDAQLSIEANEFRIW